MRSYPQPHVEVARLAAADAGLSLARKLDDGAFAPTRRYVDIDSPGAYDLSRPLANRAFRPARDARERGDAGKNGLV